MKKVAILENAVTPYRPPLFEYIGKYVDLSVFYVGQPASYRQWDPSCEGKNYDSVLMDDITVGPATFVPEIKDYLIKGDYDQIVGASELNMLLNSIIGSRTAKKINSDFSIWTEFIITPWVQGYNRSPQMRLLKKFANPIVSKTQEHLYNNSYKIIAYSDLAKEAAINTGADERLIEVAPPWYPASILPSPPDSTVKTNDFRVLFVGRLSKRKGVDVLIDTARNYSSDDDIDFRIAGDGPLRELVEHAAAKNNPISTLGYIEGKKKSSEFIAADLLVLPSRHDAWGQVVNEAYLFDTPVVVTTTCGAEMIVPDDLTVPPERSDLLYEVIEQARKTHLTVPEQPSIEQMAKPLISSPDQ